MLLHRTRIAVMEDALDEHGLELALEERRAEGVEAVDQSEGLAPA
jgi:hypothetical protein